MLRYAVCLCSIDAKKLAAVEQEIKSAGGESISVAGDVGADDFPKRIVDATVAYVVTQLTRMFPKYLQA